MADNINQFSYPEDEISLQEIFKTLIASKKLIISTTLIFTIASIVYSLSLKPSFNSSTYLEVGYFETSNGGLNLVEEPSDLISDLNILLLKNPDNKFNQSMSIKVSKNRLIKLETTSSSAEQNANIFSEMISYIDERHSNLVALITSQKMDEISLKIELNELEISFLKENIKKNQENTKIELEAQILQLKNNLPILDQEISQLEQVIIEDSNNLKSLKASNFSIERAANSPTLEQIISSYKSQINNLKRERNVGISNLNKLTKEFDSLNMNMSDKNTSKTNRLFDLEKNQKILKNQLQMSMTQNFIKTNTIGGIQTNTIKPKTQLIISLGMILGFFTSISLIFIRSFLKNYKDSQA